MEIRTATDLDWPAIWPIFSHIVAEGRTYAYPAGLTSAQAAQLWLEPKPWHAVVAVDGPDVLGSAKMGPNRPGRGSHVATASFMVAPGARGRGVGRALGEHALTWARRNGYRSIQFNAVVEANAPAVALWQSLGFRIIGTVPAAFDHAELGLVGLHIMYREL